jgi:hypothetical protein
MLLYFLHKPAVFFAKKRIFFYAIKNISKIITSVPGRLDLCRFVGRRQLQEDELVGEDADPVQRAHVDFGAARPGKNGRKGEESGAH